MRAALTIRYVHFEDLGTFSEPLEAAGYQVRYLEAGPGAVRLRDAEAADLLVVLGGPIGVHDSHLCPFLDEELEALRARLAAHAPTLGVCLGAQLMAMALDARVASGPAKEIGWAPIELTEAGQSGPLRCLGGGPVLHWHGDAFDLPLAAARLASTTACANQAFALGRHALGFQFHPEADGRDFERWLVGHAVEIAAVPGLSVAGLREGARRFGPAAGNAGRLCLAEWLAGL